MLFEAAGFKSHTMYGFSQLKCSRGGSMKSKARELEPPRLRFQVLSYKIEHRQTGLG